MKRLTRILSILLLILMVPVFAFAASSITFSNGSRYVSSPTGNKIAGSLAEGPGRYVVLYNSNGKMLNYAKASGLNFQLNAPTLSKGANVFYVMGLKSGEFSKTNLYKITLNYTTLRTPRQRIVFSKPGTFMLSGATGATSFSTGNPKVATVDSAGRIYSKGPGSTTITVRSGSESRQIAVIVPKIRSRRQALKPWYDAMETQRQYAYNAEANWGDWRKDIASSRRYGTCITTPSVVAMRCKLVKQGSYFTGTGRYDDSKANLSNFWNKANNYARSINKRYWTLTRISKTVSGGETAKSLVKRGVIKEGDIVGGDGHTYIYYGKKNGRLRWFESNVGHGNRPKIQVASRNEKRKVVSVFSPNTFVVHTVCVNGAITTSNEYMAGETVKVSFAPMGGKKITSIKIDGKEISTSFSYTFKKLIKNQSYTFKKLDRNHNITVICN